MATAARLIVGRTHKTGAFFFGRTIEHLVEWAEPTVQAVCRAIWQEVACPSLARVVEVEDLFQEGRIGVFERAREIVTARSPRALGAAVIRSRVYDALRRLMAKGAVELVDGDAER